MPIENNKKYILSIKNRLNIIEYFKYLILNI